MNILIINAAAVGHNIPIAGFTSELVKRGHTVDVLTSAVSFPTIKDIILSTGANFIEGAPELLNPDSSKGRDLDKERAAVLGIMGTVYIAAKERVQTVQYDVIVYDFFAFPGYYLSDFTDTPLIRFFSSFAFNEALATRMYKTSEKDSWMNTIVVQSWDFTRKILEEDGFKFKYDTAEDDIVHNTPDLNILSLLKDMQPYAEEFDDRFVYTGGDFDYGKVDDRIPYREMEGKMIIYVSLGTILTVADSALAKDFVDRIIKAYDGWNVSVIISAGMALADTDFSYAPDNFYIYPSVVQTDVLQHADLFITHGGMNSIKEALYFGVPMIAMPGGADQFPNADQIEAKKIGFRLDTGDFTSDKLRDLSFEVLVYSKDEFKQNINEMKEKMRSVDSAKMTADLIEDYVKKSPSL